MSGTSLSTSVNKHFIHRLAILADDMPVLVIDDIVDEHGERLLAKGGRFTREHAALLAKDQLRKPLESCLIVAGAVDTDQIVTTANRILDTSPPMRRILCATSGQDASPLALLARMELSHPLRMLLTLAGRDSQQAREHSVTVSLLSVCMAKKLHLSDDDQLAAGLAGLLHDIGELYIDPAYLAPGKRLLPHEWAHLVVHPRIGQVLINQLASYSLSVGRAVAEHHERFDGTGYPRQVVGNHISAAGQAVAVAEIIAGVLHKDHPLERAELALKIVPGEHAHDLLSAVSGALRAQGAREPLEQPDVPEGEGVERLFWRMAHALESCQKLLQGTTASPRGRALLVRALERITTIQRAFISTGLDIYLNHNHGLHDDGGGDSAIRFEKAVATREIQWRLRDIARDVALQTAASPHEKTAFSSLIELLDDDSAAGRKIACKAPAAEPIKARAPTGFAGSQPYAI